MPGGEDAYHWSLMTGPKKEEKDSRGYRYHTKDRSTGSGHSAWQFEELDIRVGQASAMLLVRILVGKIESNSRLVEIVRGVPVVQGDKSWNCVVWVKHALDALQRDGKAVGTSNLDWNTVRNAAMEYVQQKKSQHRFDGEGDFDMSKPATFDLLEGRETLV